MFNSLGWPELAVLLVVGLFVCGPDRLPGLAAQAGRALRTLRSYARGVRDDLADDLGPEIREVNLRSLQHPRSLLIKHVLSEPNASAAARRSEVPETSAAPQATSATAADRAKGGLTVPRQKAEPTGARPASHQEDNHG